MTIRTLPASILYLVRNSRKTVPVCLVIALAVALLASVTILMDSIGQTVFAMYGYQRDLTVLYPRNTLYISKGTVSKLKQLPDINRLYPASGLFISVKTFFGRTPFVVFALRHKDAEDILRKCGLKLIQGRFPDSDKPEIVLSRDIAANRHLHLGDIALSPTSKDSYSPQPMRLVGVLDGPVWFAFTSYSYVHDNCPIALNGFLASANTRSQMPALDREIKSVIDPGKIRIWTYTDLVREAYSALSNLYFFLDIISAIIIFDIALLCGLLFLIYFDQRLSEYAALLAMGYHHGYIIQQTIQETGALAIIGWLTGAIAATGLLNYLRIIYFEPKGMILHAFDSHAYWYTFAMPVFIVLFALVTISLRMLRIDPVSIMERRS